MLWWTPSALRIGQSADSKPKILNHTIPSSTLSNPQTLKPNYRKEHRPQGLYNNCDEKYIPDHCCQSPKILLMLDDEPTSHISHPYGTKNCTWAQNPSPTKPNSPHVYLSMQAMQGFPSPHALHFHGTIFGQQVMILVDSRSSHNIIQPSIASFL